MPSMAPSGTESQKVELILAQLDSLPPLAPVATRILALTEDSKSNARQIIELVESDPALAARVLSLLSRVEHGMRREAITIKNAVLMLGFDTVRQLTLAIKVMEVFGSTARPGDASDFDRTEFWKHCLGVACAARRIAMSVPAAVQPEEAFVLGLLHDIGKDALNATMPKSFGRIIRKSKQTRADISDVERAILGVDHMVVGHRLAERWGLPRRLVECIWLHHHEAEALPASVAAGRHVQIVQLADTIVREHRIGFSGNHHIPISSRELAARLRLSESDRLGIVEALAEEIESRAAWIGTDEISSSEVYLKALLRSTEELTTANSDLSEQNRRLERKAGYFAALGWLNQAVSPGAAVHEVCGAGAEVLRRALSVPVVLTFVDSEDARWLDIGLSDGSIHSEILELPPDTPHQSGDKTMALQSAMAGTWIAPPGQSFSGLIDRYRGVFAPGPVWLLPLVRERRWVGGALFAVDGEAVGQLRGDGTAIEAVSSAVGLVLAQAQAQTAAVALSDELAEANRRLSSMQPELLRAKTLETVVAMAAGAAHELNNPLAVISGRAQMLRDRAGEQEGRDILGAIVDQAHACSDIVTELMEFAQPRTPSPSEIDLGKCLDSLRTELASAALLAPSAFSIEVPSDTPPVRFDDEQLTRLFRELIKNAIEATDASSRRLTVKATGDLTDKNIVVVVADNGRGMTEEVRSRATDPFFSHRPAGRGRGLGLARVHRWLQQNGGTIRIDSEPGQGTRVEVQLPATG
ncbi:MAG: HDOD domain-containing protein [Phycisphaerae bacterium]|nr:HDOD domain-containing protein [Phycisphaerae bacterium]